LRFRLVEIAEERRAMTAALTLNERALLSAEALLADAAALRLAVQRAPNGARVLDCGVAAPGGLHAGLGLARVCLAALADVALAPGTLPDLPCPQIQVATDHPVAACMASQYAGWQVSVGKYFAMGSGPMRAAYGKEELFDHIPGREQAPVAVGALETRKLPPPEVLDYLAERVRLPADRLTLLAAPAASLAGTVQVVARALETALHKLHELKFDLGQIVSGYGVAPLPPVAADELTAIGRTNDAILYGGRVTLWVRADDAVLAEVGPKAPSCSSPAHGEPFAEVFRRAGGDFYQIDKALFSPATLCFHNLASGRSHVFGRLEIDVLRHSFFGAAP
jgi:methenyltetrahydromethanopterin cyclohydrolase